MYIHTYQVVDSVAAKALATAPCVLLLRHVELLADDAGGGEGAGASSARGGRWLARLRRLVDAGGGNRCRGWEGGRVLLVGTTLEVDEMHKGMHSRRCTYSGEPACMPICAGLC